VGANAKCKKKKVKKGEKMRVHRREGGTDPIRDSRLTTNMCTWEARLDRVGVMEG